MKAASLPVAAVADDEAPAHRPLAHGWRLWSVVEVRGAGFAAEGLAPFRGERSTAAADLLLDAAEGEQQARAAFFAAARALHSTPLDEGSRRAVARALSKAGRGRAVVVSGLPAALGPSAEALAAARERSSLSQAALAAAFEDEERQRAEAARALVEDGDFRRALAWQNPSALAGAFAALRRRSAGERSSGTRKAELLALSYLQRYATKNDTVGFFGPVGWATLDDDGDRPLAQRPGAALVASSSVQLEPWAVEALARALLIEERLLPHAPTTLPAAARLEDGCLTGVGRSPLAVRQLSPLERALLELVLLEHGLVEQGGLASASTLAAKAAAALGVPAEEALAKLSALRRQGLVRAALPVRITDAPEAGLLAALAAMPDVPAVEDARRRAGALLDATAALTAVLDDAPALEAGLARAGAAFQEVTGVAPERRPGELYACRTPFLLNCRRDGELRFGAPVVERLAPLLAPVLAAARWFTYEAAREFQSLLAVLVEERRRGRGAVPLAEVYRALVPLFARGRPAFFARVSLEVRRRLTAALGPLELQGGRHVHVEGTAFADRMRDAFAAPQPGWPSARHHSPDVLLAAEGEEAFAAGRFTPVLGEVHAGINTLAVLQAVTQHPRPGVLAALQRRDIPPLVVEVQHDSYALCAQDSLLGPDDVHLDTGAPWRSWLPRPPLRLGDLDVVLEDGFLRAVCRRTGWRGELLQVLERVLKLNATTELRLSTDGAWRPRVSVDGAVLQREGWELEREAFAAVVESRGSDRFLAARRLRRELDLPAMLFARVPSELKPVFVDLRSPPSVDVLARLARQAERLSLSEMLPSLDELWLRGDGGGRYVAELRLVAVDPVPWSPIPLS